MSLVDAAKKAIQDVFGDTGVPPAETREALEELRDEIDAYLDTIPSDGEEEDDGPF